MSVKKSKKKSRKATTKKEKKSKKKATKSVKKKIAKPVVKKKVVTKKISGHISKKKNVSVRKRGTKERFKIGAFVVYPMHGVGEIHAIQKQVILGKRKECYMLEISSNNMRVMIPVENSQVIGIRSIISKREVKKVIDLLKKDEVDTEEDWKIRYQNNLNKIKSGDIFAVAEVCRNLYKRARDKELSLMERRLYESAYSLITSEIAVTRGETVETSSNLISEVLS